MFSIPTLRRLFMAVDDSGFIKKGSINYLWWIPALVSLAMVLATFLLGGWFWGVMDDIKYRAISGSVWQETVRWFGIYLKIGRLMPTTALHMAFFYKLFSNNPTAFFIFRWVEVVATLGIWSIFVAKASGRKWAAGLFFAITLGFYKFYESFFFLSITEVIALFFAGLGVLFFFQGIKSALEHGGKIRKRNIIFSLLALLAALGAKETFFILVLAMGVSAMAVSIRKAQLKNVFWLGAGFLIFSIAYALVLKFCVVRDYSAQYGVFDLNTIFSNIMTWVVKDLPCHLPWILAVVILMARGKWPKFPALSQRFGVIFSILLYVGYVLVLLPWKTWGHYVIPLGLFFALMIALLITDHLESLGRKLWWALFAAILFFNIITASSVLRWHYSYQRDTQNLVEWLARNVIFEHDISSGALVRGNAMEACDAIPGMVRFLYGKQYASFIATSSVREILQDPLTRYFLFDRFGGDQDLRRLGDMWTPVFLSDHWIMFRRMY
jgi:hypothetical protein